MRALPSIDEMPVVILCGGQGTRIRDVTESVPKPLIDIGGEPILWHIMKLYGHHGARKFTLCLGYKSWLIKDYFLRYREHLSDFTIQLGRDHELRFLNGAGDEDWEVTCLETGLLAGTGARLWRVRDRIDTDTFLFTYGDGLGSVDITRLVEFHASHDKLATVTGVHPSSRYGEMRVDRSQVVEFNEKPTVAEGWVSGGFFVFDRGVFDYLTDEEGLMLEAEPLRKLARDSQLMVFPHDDFWMGMDTYREYTQLNAMWKQGDAPWKVWS